MIADRQALAAALPNYEVGAELGRGGWGVVLAGRHTKLGRDVAIKQLPPTFANDAEVRARFTAEAQVLASLDHPHIVPIYDYVEDAGLCLLVMEKLPGGTVWDRFTGTGLTPQASCAVVIATCAGLDCAHRNSTLHRDIKPENLMFSAQGTLKVTDFGIAKVVGGEETLATRSGSVLGTPAYMAPEQATGDDLSPATDVYAVGTMLYELLSGELPFPESESAVALLWSHASESPVHIQQKVPGLPDDIAGITMRTLATDPHDRYQSAEDLAVALGEAAAREWGPDWLASAAIPIIATGRLASVTQRPSSPVDRAPTAGAESPSVEEPPARSTRSTVRPAPLSVSAHRAPRAVADVRDLNDVVPVRSIIERPGPPTVHVLAALGLLVLAVVLAFAGLGSPRHSAGAPAGTFSVAGSDVSSGQAVKLDLAEPIVVTGVVPAGVEGVERVELSFTAAGLPLASTHQTVPVDGGGRFDLSLEPTSTARYIVASRVTGELELVGGGGTLAATSFPVDAEQTIVSAPGALTVVLLLLALAYTESLLRSMRKGRKRISGLVSLAVTGALWGVVVVLAAWLLGGKEPVISTVAVCAVAGAAAGIAAAFAARRASDRRLVSKFKAREQQLVRGT